MIANLPSYPDYKTSGVEWLGDVPAHWKVRRLRNLAKMRVSNVDKHVKEGELPVRLCNYVDVYKNDRITGITAYMRATATPAEIKRFRLELGDVLITKDSETWNDIGVPALVQHTADDLVCGYHLAVLRPLKTTLSGAFLFRALQSPTVANQFHTAAKGVTRYGLTHEAIKSPLLPLPPLAEQNAIVRYLDHVDGRIQRYIEAKEKLISLLQEARQATIHSAVTRGLDPDVPLKPSGVEWLGDVPAHWEIVPNRYLMSLKKDIVGDQSGSYTLLSLTKQGIIKRDMEKAEGKFPASFDTYQVVKPGDLIFCLFDIDETPRTVGLSGFHGMITSAYSRFVCEDETTRKFLYFLYLALDNGKLLKPLYSGLRKVISKTTFLRTKVALPPKKEQIDILSFLDKTSADIDATIDKARRQCEFLREYRTSLIAHVVTGKLDVRAAAAQLPQGAHEQGSAVR